MRLLVEWDSTKNTSVGLQLRRNLTKPYRLVAVFERKRWCFVYPPTYPISVIKELAGAANAFKTLDKFREKEKSITEYLDYGG